AAEEPYADIAGREMQAGDAAAAFLVVVLDPFLRLEHRRLAAGHDPLHQPRRRAEGGRHFGRFHDAEAPARAGADEDHAAPLAQRLRDDLDAVSDLLTLL